MRTILLSSLALAALASFGAAQAPVRPTTPLPIKLGDGRIVDPGNYKGKVVVLALAKFT